MILKKGGGGGGGGTAVEGQLVNLTKKDTHSESRGKKRGPPHYEMGHKGALKSTRKQAFLEKSESRKKRRSFCSSYSSFSHN